MHIYSLFHVHEARKAYSLIDEHLIGKRIKEIRERKNITQAKLAAAADISITQISGYENGKTPSLSNLAKISQALEVTLDRLYFGDESERFITSAADDGHIIVNCLAQLYSHDVIHDFVYLDPEEHYRYSDNPPYPYMLPVFCHQNAISRLLMNFNEVEKNINTYTDPSEYIKQIKDSVANEING